MDARVARLTSHAAIGTLTWADALRMGLLALSYFALAQLGLAFSTVGATVTPVWPSSGLALAVLILGGLRLWPGVFAGSLATSLVNGLPWWAGVSIAGGSTLEAVLPVVLLQRLLDYRGEFERPRQVVGFVGFAGLVGAPCAALVGAVTLGLAGAIDWLEFETALLTLWVGDAAGAIVIGPMILAANQLVLRTEERTRYLEFVGLLAVQFGIGGTIFVWGVPGVPSNLPLSFLAFPLLIGMAWSFGIGGAAMSSFVLSIMAIWGTSQGSGPFGGTTFTEGVGLLLAFITTMSTTALIFAAYKSQRDAVLQQLRQREWQLSEAQRLGSMGDWFWDLRGDRIAWSDGTFRIFGRDPATFVPTYPRLLDAIHRDDRALFETEIERVKREHEPSNVDFRIRRPEGAERILWSSLATIRDEEGKPQAILGTVMDVTERRQLESDRSEFQRKILETQKLESLGLLAGGIAHDFNNILTGVLGNASLLRVQLPPDSPMIEGLRRIETAAERAADLCRQMLAYSGKGRFIVRHIDLNELVRSSWSLLQTSVSKKTELEFFPGKDLPLVFADPSQMRQVLMNLVINGSEALGDEPGRVTIRTGVRRLDGAFLAEADLVPESTDGTFVYLEVSDNGCGIAPEVRRRIFDPFFTTKFTGRGLGLAAVAGIVRTARGAIRVDTAPNEGTRLCVCVPTATEAAPEESGPLPARPEWRGSGTVLLVDDEEAVRDVGSRLLGRLGLGVVTADDGLKAAEWLAANPRVPRLVLLDLTMPNLGGLETMHRLRAIRPDLPVVLMSGYERDDAVARFDTAGLAGFLQKPFTPESLAAVVRPVVDGPQPPPAASG
jgi:PAS domain S-box-containing protein